MLEFNTITCKIFREHFANYSLLEIIHHVVGNELASIMGYTHRLQRAIRMVEQSPEWTTGIQSCEKREEYLRTIEHKEEQLNAFLVQVRRLVTYPANTRFCSTGAEIELTSMVHRVINELFPLFGDKEVQVSLPELPCTIVCDPLWIEMTLEHLFTHNLAFHDSSEPARITLACYNDPANHLHEVQIRIRITPRSAKRPRMSEGQIHEAWFQTLDQRDLDVCIMFFSEIVQEHGGRVWTEQEQGRAETMAVSLPLVNHPEVGLVVSPDQNRQG